MSPWSSLQVLLTTTLYLTCADITTESFTTGDDLYNNNLTFSTYENKTIKEVDEANTELPSVFDRSNYNNSFNGNEVNETLGLCQMLDDGQMEACVEFQDIMESMKNFSLNFCLEYNPDVIMNKSIDFLNYCYEKQTCGERVEIVNKVITALHVYNTGAFDTNLYNILSFVITAKKTRELLNLTFDLGLLIKQMTKIVKLQEKGVHDLEDLLNHVHEQTLNNIFVASILKYCIDLTDTQIQLRKQIEYFLRHKHELASWKKIDVVLFQVRLAAFILVLIFGVTSNTILVAVFVKYRNMRTTANIMLMNLTLVDCICLILILPLTYLQDTVWPFGVGGCRALYFVRSVTICVSTYSVAMISIQRFLAVRSFPTADGCTLGEKTKSILMLAGVWLLGILYSLPRLIFPKIVNGICHDVNDDDDNIGIIHTANLVVIYVVPTLLMTVFSCLVAAKIKKSVAIPTGERIGQEQLRHNRVVSANVLLVLAVLFVVSYSRFIFIFYTYQLQITIETFIYMCVIDTVMYVLQFTNSCLNPIALFIMSQKYRKYVQEILSCWRIPRSPQKAMASSDTSDSTIEPPL